MSDIDQPLYNRLFAAFQEKGETGIAEAERALFYPNYPDFISFLKEFSSKQTISMCPASWTDSVCGRCYDCQKSESSCLCLPCFLAGHHDEHHSSIAILNGTCDCGDPLFWKPEGNCPHHQSCVKHPEIEYLTEDERKRFLSIFLAAFDGTFKFSTKSPEFPSGRFLPLTPVLTWLLRFVDCGDSLRRLLSIALCRVADEDVTKTIYRANEDESTLLFQFIIRLASDRYFRSHFNDYIYKHFNEFYTKLFEQLNNETPNLTIAPYFGILEYTHALFHFFNKESIKSGIKRGSFNDDILINYLNSIIDLITANVDHELVLQLGGFQSILQFKVVFDYLNEIKDYNRINNCIEKLVPILIKMERLLPYYTKEKPEDDGDEYGQILNVFLSKLWRDLLNSIVCTKLNIQCVFDGLVNLYTIQELEDSNPKDSPNVSLFKPQARIRLSLPLTSLFYKMLIEYHEDIEHVLKSNCERCSISVDDFLIRTSVYLIRYFGLIRNLNHFYKFMNQSTSNSIIYLLNSVHEMYSDNFVYLQYIMCLVQDKERFFKAIAACFGLFDELRPTDSFLQFVESLLIDRLLIKNDWLEIQRNQMIIRLKIVPKCTVQQLSFPLSKSINDQVVADELLSIADHVIDQEGKSYFKLKNGVDVNYFFPLNLLSNVVDVINMNVDKFIHFYYNVTDQFVDNLKIPTFSSTVMSVVFSSLIDFRDTSSSLFALSTLMLTCQLNQIKMTDEIQIDNKDLNELMTKLTVKNFLKAKVDNKTLIDYANQFEYGEKFLELCNIGYQSKQKPEERKQANKEKARLIKQSIMDDFQAQRSSFTSKQLPQGILDVESTTECPLCHESMSGDDELVGYPAMIAPSLCAKIMQTIIDNNKWMLGFPNEGILDIVICNHPMHLKCKPESRVYPCPLCKSLRMLILPSIPKNLSFETQNVNETLMNAIDTFISSYFDNQQFGALLNLIRTLDYEVHNHELRFRTKPDTLDKNEFRIILENVFRIVYFKNLTNPDSIDQSIVDNMRVPLVKFIHEVVKSRSTNNFVCDKNKTVNESILNCLQTTLEFFKDELLYNEKDNDEVQTAKRVKLYEFLRRVLIFCYFGIREDSVNIGSTEKVIDWDSILTFPNLCRIFEIKKEQEIKPNEDIVLKAFAGPPLSEKFISNCQKPYSYDIFDMKVSQFLDMMTGIVVPGEQLMQYAQIYYKLAASIYLVISGKDSSSVFVFVPLLSRQIKQRGFYLDQFGDEDPGFARGAITHLSSDRLEKSIDSFAANDFMNLLYH